jgi:glucose-1-phosphate adenylyltransferase
VNSNIAPGCAVDGAVVHSVLMPGVRIEKGAVVENAVILTGVVVRAGAVIKQCVLTDQAAVEIAK